MQKVDSSTLACAKVFCVATPKIVWECFDDELVVINLDSGKYYSLNGSAAAIWTAMEAGRTPAETVAWILDGDRTPEAGHQILEFWKTLVDESLIAEAPPCDGARTAIPEAPSPAQPWTPPSLSAYSDMADLFTLDPIHDVDEAGWPSRPPEAA